MLVSTREISFYPKRVYSSWGLGTLTLCLSKNTAIVPKSNRKIVDRIKIDSPTHDGSISWLGTCTSIKGGMV